MNHTVKILTDTVHWSTKKHLETFIESDMWPVSSRGDKRPRAKDKVTHCSTTRSFVTRQLSTLWLKDKMSTHTKWCLHVMRNLSWWALDWHRYHRTRERRGWLDGKTATGIRNDLLQHQTKQVLTKLHEKHPSDQYELVFTFDHSTIHTKLPEDADALRVTQMCKMTVGSKGNTNAVDHMCTWGCDFWWYWHIYYTYFRMEGDSLLFDFSKRDPDGNKVMERKQVKKIDRNTVWSRDNSGKVAPGHNHKSVQERYHLDSSHSSLKPYTPTFSSQGIGIGITCKVS